VLDTLDDVPWAELTHAYGSAADVPDTIRGLTSPDGEVRKSSRLRLWSSIFHQGTRWEASSYAVPFLVELAADASVADRQEILDLLVHLAVGYQDPWLRHGFQREEVRCEQEALDSEGNEWKVDVVNVYDAVVAHAATLVALAENDPDAGVRRAAVYAVAFLPDASELSLPALARVIARERDKVDLANAVLAQGLLAGGRDHQDPPFDGSPLVTLASDRRPLVRYAGGSAVARVTGAAGSVDPTAIDALLGVLAEHPDALAGSGLAWNDDDLTGLGWIVIEATVPVFGIELVERAATTLRSLDGSRAVTLTRVLLSRLFPHGASPPPQQASRLTPEQRVLVETLASEPRIWTTRGMQFGNFSVMLTGHGLPGDAGSMQRYLGGEILEECLPAGMRRQRTSG
jgi:HEAT repeat protein